MSDALNFLVKYGRERALALLLMVAVTALSAHGMDDAETALWLPPHINSELNTPSFYHQLMPLIRSDALFFTSSLLLELARLISYQLVSRATSIETALFLSDSITRLLDASIDYSLSEDYGDFSLRAFFSNMDKLPWFSSGSRYSRISRRGLIYLYIFRRYIARLLPESSPPRVPASVYLHDPAQEKMLYIVLIPPSSSAEYDPTAEHSSYFILSRKDSDVQCDPAKAKENNAINRAVHLLNCQPSIRVHLYPQKWQGENRLFLRIFREGVAGPLYLSPYSYGKVSDRYFFSDLMDHIEDIKSNDAAFKARQDNYFGQFMHREQNSTIYQARFSSETDRHCFGRYHVNIANPLDEKTFLLIARLLEQLPGHWPDQPDPLPSLKDSMADALLLEPLAPDFAPEPGETIETETLSLISGGRHSFLVLDQGADKNRVPVMSLETRYALASVEQTTLEKIEQLRSGRFSDLWWLAVEATNLMAMQLLTEMMQRQFNKHYSKPLNEEDYVNPEGKGQDKARKAPVRTRSGGNAVKNHSDESGSRRSGSKRPQREKKRPWKLREDDNGKKRSKPPQHHRRDMSGQPEKQQVTARKKARGERGEEIVTLEADEPEGSLRKRTLPPGSHSESTRSVSGAPDSPPGIRRALRSNTNKKSNPFAEQQTISDRASTSSLPSLEVNIECLTCLPERPLQEDEPLVQTNSGSDMPAPPDDSGDSVHGDSDDNKETTVDASSVTGIVLPWRYGIIEASDRQETDEIPTQSSAATTQPLTPSQPVIPAPKESESQLLHMVQSLEAEIEQSTGRLIQEPVVPAPAISFFYRGAESACRT